MPTKPSRTRKLKVRKLTLVTATCAAVCTPQWLLANTQPSFFSKSNNEVDTSKVLRIDIPHEVKDLAYGEFLYDYFQEKYFSAITKALIADHRKQFTHHDEQVQVLVGTLFVGYGLLDEAERIFNDLLEHTTEEQTREEIWFNLAELYYKRGDSEKSISLLDTHLLQPSEAYQTPVALLYSLNLLSQNKLEAAIDHLKKVKSTRNLSAYAYLNLGSVYSHLEQPEQAEKQFLKLLKSKGKNELVKNIKDRAALALGKHYLEEQQFKHAEQAFKKIRLNSAAANTGLLGLGWAHFKSEDPVGALTPWMELLNRSNTDRAVQEAYINIPYAYEQLGAMQLALEGYQKANAFYQEEQSRLQDIKTSIRNSDWVDQLTPVIDFSFNPLDKIPAFKPPQDPSSLYLYKLFATHDFNEAYRNYRELQRLMHVLNHWHQQIPIFHQMIASHVARMNKLAPHAKAKLAEGEAIFKEVSEKLDVLSNKLNKAISEDDTTITANTKQLNLLDRIKALEEKVNLLPDTIDYQAEKDRFRVVKGLLMWDLNSTAIERRWERIKDRVFIENQLTDLERNLDRIETINAQRLSRFQGFEKRITDLSARLQALFKESQHALIRHRVYLKGIASQQLDKHQAHLQQLQANALYAIARLQDMAFSQHREQSLQMMGEPSSSSQNEILNKATDTTKVINESKEREDSPKSVPLSERKSLFEGSLKESVKSWLDVPISDERKSLFKGSLKETVKSWFDFD